MLEIGGPLSVRSKWATVFLSLLFFGCPKQPEITVLAPESPTESEPAQPDKKSSQDSSEASKSIPLELESTSQAAQSESQLPNSSTTADSASKSSSVGTSSAGQKHTSSSGSGGSNSDLADAATRKQAQILYRQAKAKASAGDTAGAFVEARNAWDLAQGLTDPADNEFAGQIRADLDALARQISSSRQGRPVRDDRPLILK